jgi:DNA-binding response OmpR family regulator
MQILVVEDEFLVRERLALDLQDVGHSVVQAAYADDALRVSAPFVFIPKPPISADLVRAISALHI